MATLEIRSTIRADVEDVFAFHLDPRNAARIAPPGMRVLEVDAPARIAAGDRIRMAVRSRPLPTVQRWDVAVERVEPPHEIVDRAIRSPFRSWRHVHRFTAVADGTELVDEITYALPLGVIGRIVDRIAVRRVLTAAFGARHERTRALLERRPAAARFGSADGPAGAD